MFARPFGASIFGYRLDGSTSPHAQYFIVFLFTFFVLAEVKQNRQKDGMMWGRDPHFSTYPKGGSVSYILRCLPYDTFLDVMRCMAGSDHHPGERKKEEN